VHLSAFSSLYTTGNDKENGLWPHEGYSTTVYKYYCLINDAAWGPSSVQSVQLPCKLYHDLKKDGLDDYTKSNNICVTKNGEYFLRVIIILE